MSDSVLPPPPPPPPPLLLLLLLLLLLPLLLPLLLLRMQPSKKRPLCWKEGMYSALQVLECASRCLH